jgi:2-polyprenyl-3-methyl-5-hydroxy-6-metoxy-1,4-benzoquinol methylase
LNFVDWTKITDNPCNLKAHQKISEYLEPITDVWGTHRTSNLMSIFKDKSVLDIGAGEHSTELYAESTWEHGLIKKVAKRLMGLDIRPELVEHYNKKGFNFRCVDATSDEYMGEKFDIIFVGDVIEHVNNPVKLLEFCKRHVDDNGKIIFTTPNPFSLSWFFTRILRRRRLYVGNLDHVFWVSPTNALELGRRANLVLSKVHLAHANAADSIGNNIRLFVLNCARLIVSSECCFDEYVYEYRIR